MNIALFVSLKLKSLEVLCPVAEIIARPKSAYSTDIQERRLSRAFFVRKLGGFRARLTRVSDFAAGVVTPVGTTCIATFIKRGKVPVWSFNEVIDPTFSDPLGIAAKEFAAKLARILFNAQLSDAQVNALIAKTSGSNISYRDVYELGFSNNPRAIPQLLSLTANKDDEVHQAAFSSLGILRDARHFDVMATATQDANSDWPPAVGGDGPERVDLGRSE